MSAQLHRRIAASPHHFIAIGPSQILPALPGRRAAGRQAEMPSTQPDTGTTAVNRHVDSDAVGPVAALPGTEPSALQIKRKGGQPKPSALLIFRYIGRLLSVNRLKLCNQRLLIFLAHRGNRLLEGLSARHLCRYRLHSRSPS